MEKKSLVFQRLLTLIILVVCSFGIVGFKRPDANLEKPVYIVSDESDYFRLITFSTMLDSNIPILLVSDADSPGKLDNFQKYYQGTSTYLTSQQIDNIILDRYPNPSEVVVTDTSSGSMLFASLISSARQIPLFVGTIPLDIQNNKKLSSIIAVGDVKLATSIKTENLDSFEKAQNYYNHLVDKTETAVVISDPEVYSIGAEAVAYHRAKVFFNIEDGKSSKTENFIWVTLPENLGQPNFHRLYASDSENNVNAMYSQNIGVITGFTVEDMSFLLARTFAYHDMHGDWKNSFVVANVFSNEPPLLADNGSIEIQYLGNSSLNEDSFTNAISSSSYVYVLAHGDPSGLNFNGNHWPQKGEEFYFSPLVFVAEACSTLDFSKGDLENNVMLKLISSGALAFVGSTEIGGVSGTGELPFSNSTSQTPLGELTRLYNSIRLDIDADEPRGVLIGDPLLFQTTEQSKISPVNSAISGDGLEYIIQDGEPDMDIVVKPQSSKEIVRATAFLENGDKLHYYRGAFYFGRSLGVISNVSGQTVLFNWPGGSGRIILYDHWSLPSRARLYLSDSMSGIQALLLDLTTINNNQWLFLAVTIILMVFIHKRFIMNKKRLLSFLFASSLISLSLFLFLADTSLIIKLPITLALFMWCFISFCFYEKRENTIKKLFLSLFFFLIPFLYGLFTAIAMGASRKTCLLVFQGIVLLSIVFFIMQFLIQKNHRIKKLLPKT